VVGGFLLTGLGDIGWRLVFAINLPLGAAALALLWFRVPPDAAGESRRLDWLGGLLVTAALLCLAVGLTGEGGEGSSLPDPTRALLLGGIGLVLLVAFLVVESRVAEPMLPLRLFASRSFSGANALTFCLYFALAAISFYQPMMLIAGWGRSPAEVSVSFLPLGIALTLLSRFTGALADRMGAGPPIAAGSAIVAIAFFGLGLTAPGHALWWTIVPLMALMGIGMGLVVSPLSTAVMTGVEDADTGIASGVNNAVARGAGLFAVALMGLVVNAVFQGVVSAPDLSFGRPVPPGTLAPELEAARVGATDLAFRAVAWCVALLALVSGVIAWWTLERRFPRRAVA
jgi:predicted MFS family arabinose efflux permease